MRWWAIVAVAGLCGSAARADTLLHRQGPGRGFGVSSDTEYTDDFGRLTGALTADRFTLDQSASACRVIFWSFFGGSNEFTDPGPPLTESIRVRLYSEVAGLPGDVLDEATYAAPARFWTGFFVAESPLRKEYQYQVELPTCWNLFAGTNYWIEVAQLGDPESNMRWEHSSGGQFAQSFPIGAPWRISTSVVQMAYELRTPEPGSGVLVILGIGWRLRCGSVRRLR